jgi:hypothetical protein
MKYFLDDQISNCTYTLAFALSLPIYAADFTTANGGNENVTGGFAGTALRVVNENNLTLVADVKFGGISDEYYVADNISLYRCFRSDTLEHK